MNDLYSAVLEVLRRDGRFFSPQGVLLKNAVYEAAMGMDEKLLRLLYDDPVVRARFFTDMGGIAVFDKIAFGWVINNRAFLPDSYTRYKNKIGLTDGNGEPLSASGDVVLAFPYKDCVLAGGQTKEDQKRGELFYNATLAPEQVDRLLSPKVLSNARRYTAQGVSETEEILPGDNLLIKGNNLLVLSSLSRKYAGKVRMMYWDAPYNTGADSFGYNDRFSRSSYLLFIKNRVEAAMPMLLEDGVLLIHCSFHQYPYLKVLLDEVIGNYVMTFHVLVRHPDRTLTGDKEFNDVIEYVLVYSKRPGFKMPKKAEGKSAGDYRWEVTELTGGTAIELGGRKGRVFLPGEYLLTKEPPARERFKIMTVRGSLREKVSSGRFYVKYLQPLEGKYPPKTLFKIDGIGDDMYSYRYFYLPPEGNKNGAYLQGMPTSSDVTYKPYPNFLDFVRGYNGVNKEGNVEFRNGKKPEELVAFFMELFTSEGDLVLDAFGGSGTTAAVALKMGRRFILSEQMDYAETVTVKRIWGVLRGEEKDILPEYPVKEGAGFVYLELAKLNQRFADRLEAASDGELPAIWADMRATGLINCRMEPSALDPGGADFLALTLAEKKRILMDVLDLNQLYVCLCDMDDESMGIPDRDKRLTANFYGEP